MLAAVVVLFFVVTALAFAAYALIRPFTHIHYHHFNDRLWRPLD